MVNPKQPPTRVLLARHGQTESNTAGLFCGHSETRLTAAGEAQSRALGRRLAEVDIAAVYTSDLSRAMDTAALALEGRNIQLTVDADLREIHYGDWEMQRERVVARSGSAAYALLRAEDPAWQPPGGETLKDVRDRTNAALRRILRRHPHQTTLVVTHGTALNCLLAELLAIDPAFTFRIAIGNCALSEVAVAGGRPIVTRINDGCHLEALPGTAA